MTEVAMKPEQDSITARALNRAELYLCLGHAFMPPMQAGSCQALARDLAADLDELLPDIGAGLELAEAIAAVADDKSLLRSYSRLFLVPPYPAPLNAGLYIDQTIMGPSVVEMERFYQRHGLARDAGFRDMPDHLALQLQFLALLLGSAAQAAEASETLYFLEEARDFLNRFLRPWPNAWVRRLEQECQAAAECRPYALLGRLVRDGLDADARWLQSVVPAPTPEMEKAELTIVPRAPDAAPAKQSVCARCSKPFVPAGELIDMIHTLQRQGLDASHLSVCPGCRTAAMGLNPTSPTFKEIRPGRDTE
ncbi:MAG: molecular chaperone TorD family protein [Ectothiorhodospiraceae bacterium]|nr:molecular chaperone TorD family protein [Ectothiorhodospiraceae bacterium]MCH8503355.1 molecular chaperone TorD family protein [Ectothiorhodospiraceae bacterium]